MRRGGLIAFNTIIEFDGDDTVKIMTEKALPQFVSLLHDKSLPVRQAASKTLSRISQFYP